MFLLAGIRYASSSDSLSLKIFPSSLIGEMAEWSKAHAC